MTKSLLFHVGNLMPKAETKSQKCHLLSENEKEVLTSLYHLQKHHTQNPAYMGH